MATDALTTAQLLDDARLGRRCLDASGVLVTDLASAYDVQDALTARRLVRGGRQVGWKLGYTSEAMRSQLGIDEPNLGPLLSTMVVPDGGRLGEELVQPRVEPEIALVMDRSLAPGATVGDVLGSCSAARAALEVVDSIWSDYRFDLVHNTADGSSAAAVVLGPELPLDVLGDIEVALDLDGEVVARGRGSDAAGHPAAAVAWLATALAARGRSLAAGDVVITGGLTRAIPLEPGSQARAVYAHDSFGTVSVSVHR